MDSRNVDMNQRDGGVTAAPSLPADQLRSRAGNMVFKSGPLFISSKGIGWTSWKKRWFILTRTSLVFFRSDPSIIPQRGSEVNLTLGGIDLNNSGSVVVREDKKLLTVLFPDGRDGRAFTLKAETSEDLYDWKAALENALAQAPSAALVIGQNGIFRNDPTDTVDMSSEQGGDRRPAKSLVVGRPILLALEDIDGAPSFLEKALTFVEQYGVKVEGIFRHAADVDDVDRRLQEYEQGKNEFSPEEDAHVIADCIKRVIRELPSSPVPASCCKALLEACRTDRKVRLNAMRAAISETFPEPNRLLLQRILKMMQIVASHKSENRMTSSAVAACMAPLLLGPLMAGDCELDNDFSMAGDSSLQLMQAAAAANHAQAIVITLLEEYNKLFGEGSISPDLYSELEESGSEDEEPSDDDGILEDNGFVDSEEDLDADTEDDHEGASSETVSESSNNRSDDQYDDKSSEGSDSDLGSHHGNEDFETSHKASRGNQMPLSQHDNVQSNGNLHGQSHTSLVMRTIESCEPPKVVPTSASLEPKSAENGPSLCITKSTNKSNEPLPGVKRPTIWGRTSARKNLSMEAIDITIEDEDAVQRLETTKTDLQNRIAKEAKENALLHGRLERRKQALHERRLALEQDVARLQEQLQKEKDLRKTMEAGLNTPLGCLPIPANIDKKTKEGLEEIAQAESDIINLKQKVSDLHVQLNQQCKNNFGSVSESCSQHQQSSNDQARQKDLQEVEGTTAAPHHERSKRSEDTSSITDSRKVRTQNPPSLSKKQPADKQQLDSTVHESTEPVEAAATSSSIEPVTVAPDASSSSKKSGAKVEVNAFLSVQQDTSYTTDSEKVRTQNALSLPRKQPTEKKQLDSPFLLKKQVAEKKQLDSAIHDSTKSGVAAATSSSVESVTAASTASSNSKKSAAKVEQGNVSTSSALAKLTTRLNFLKERRTQVVNELQNIEHGRGSDGHSLGPPPLTNSR